MACRSVIMMAFLVITLVACALVPFVEAGRGGLFRVPSAKFRSQNHLQNDVLYTRLMARPYYLSHYNKSNTNNGNGASTGRSSDHTAALWFIALFMVAVPLILIVVWYALC